MNTYEYNIFDDAYVPYIVYPEANAWLEIRFARRLPFFTRWLIYRTLFGSF